MTKTKRTSRKFSPIRLLFAVPLILLVAQLFFVAQPGYAVQGTQKTLPAADSASAPHRTRLILKDGSYQIVMSYRIVGNMVRYISAERGGEEEEIPVALVDFDATHRWEKQHDPRRPAPTPDDAEAASPSTPNCSRKRPTAPHSPRRSPKIFASRKQTAPSLSIPSAARPSLFRSPRPTAT